MLKTLNIKLSAQKRNPHRRRPEALNFIICRAETNFGFVVTVLRTTRPQGRLPGGPKSSRQWSIVLFFFRKRRLSVKNYAGRQPRRVPIALHSNQSAMALLHTIPPALLITETGPARYVTISSDTCTFMMRF